MKWVAKEEKTPVRLRHEKDDGSFMFSAVNVENDLFGNMCIPGGIKKIIPRYILNI